MQCLVVGAGVTSVARDPVTGCQSVQVMFVELAVVHAFIQLECDEVQ